jgi:tetratricopeptide (TPR) repeat protein
MKGFYYVYILVSEMNPQRHYTGRTQISSATRWEEGATLTMLGVARLNQNQLDDAEKYLREGEDVYRQTLGDENFYLAMNISRQANVFLAKNDLKVAEQKAKDALAMLRDFSTRNNFASATPMLILGQILVKAGRAREAEEYLRQALAIYEAQTRKNFSVIAEIKISLSQSLLAQNRLLQAEAIAFEAHDEVARNLSGQHPALKSTAANLAKIYEKEGKSDLAAKLR